MLERIFLQYREKLLPFIKEYRVDIHLFIEKEMGFQIETYTNLKRNYSCYAFTVVGEKYIFVDDMLYDEDAMGKKLRFTLAEELAHNIIHQDLFAACNSVEERILIDSSLTEMEKDRIELNAKALAGMFLMPRELIEKIIGELIKRDILVEGSPLCDQIAGSICHDFDVNFKCARMRLRNLRYHHRTLQQLRNEYSEVD